MKSFAVVLSACLSLGSVALVLEPVQPMGAGTILLLMNSNLNASMAKRSLTKLTEEERSTALDFISNASFADTIDKTTMFNNMVANYKATGKFELPTEACKCLNWKDVTDRFGREGKPKGVDCMDFAPFAEEGMHGEKWCHFIRKYNRNTCFLKDNTAETVSETVCVVDSNCKAPKKRTDMSLMIKTCTSTQDELLTEMSLLAREKLAGELQVDTGILASLGSLYLEKLPKDLDEKALKKIQYTGVPTYVYAGKGGKRIAIKGPEVWEHKTGLPGKFTPVCKEGCVGFY